MIYITGDTHGDWIPRLNTKYFPEQKEMTKNDYVIICGDFGIWNNSAIEKYALDWLEDRPFTTLFISGNHDNYDILDNLETKEWNGGFVNFIRPSVIHLKRGQVFNIDGKTFFTFGGASSHDISAGILELDDPMFKVKKKKFDKDPFALYRINHVSWWERELPNEQEMKEGLINLEKYNNKVDYVITHSPYTSILRFLDQGFNLYKTDILTNYLQKIKDNITYKHWFFGHMHLDNEFHYDKSTCIYYDITRIE